VDIDTESDTGELTIFEIQMSPDFGIMKAVITFSFREFLKQNRISTAVYIVGGIRCIQRIKKKRLWRRLSP
jgi:hypothetical protein